jgi:hypothetical protein
VAPDRHAQLRVHGFLADGPDATLAQRPEDLGRPHRDLPERRGFDRLLRPDRVNFAYEIKNERLGKSELFLNIQNLFNNKPPPANATGSAAAPGGFAGFALTDDPIGRYFTIGFRMRR